MKQAFLDHSIKWIVKYNSTYSEEDIEKLKYGLEGIYLTITKFIIIGLLAFFLGILKETVLVLIIFNIIRYPAFGFHANKSSTCLFFSIFVFIGLTYLVLHSHYSYEVQFGVCLLCLFSFIFFAPADTPKRPLTNQKKRHIRKMCSIACAIVYIVIILLFKETLVTKLVFTSLIIETIMINPITYKIFHQTFNNYKLCQSH